MANFYEKALFVKVDLATALWWIQRLSVPFALCFYPRSLGELILVGSSAHYGIRLLGLWKALRFFWRPPRRGGPSPLAQSPGVRPEALSGETPAGPVRHSAAAWRRC